MKKQEKNTGRKATTHAVRTAKSAATTATAASNARSTVSKAATCDADKLVRERARVERWTAHAERSIAHIRDNAATADEFALVKAAADAVGMTPVGLVIDTMKREHGLADKKTPGTDTVLFTDETCEKYPTRARNNYEREQVGHCIYSLSHFHAFGLTVKQQAEVVRRHFRKGDITLREAEGRAILAALDAGGDGMDEAERIEANAAARFTGKSYAAFARDAMQAAVEAARDAAGGKLPLTRKERAAIVAAIGVRNYEYPADVIEKSAKRHGMKPAEYVANVLFMDAAVPLKAEHVKTENGVAMFAVSPK